MTKYMSMFTILTISFPILIVGMHIVKAETNNEYIQFSAFKLFSPLNKTYNSRFLTLNLTFVRLSFSRSSGPPPAHALRVRPVSVAVVLHQEPFLSADQEMEVYRKDYRNQ